MVLLLSMLGVGCALTAPEVPESANEERQESAQSRAGMQAAGQGLSRDLLYDILVAEFAQQQGDLDTAIRHYLHAARLSKDPAVAERATKLALQVHRHPDALEAAKLWVGLDPANLDAHQAAAVLYLRRENSPQAMLHFQHLLVEADKRQPGSGLQLVTTLLSRERDREAGLKIMERLAGSRPNDPQAAYSHALLAQHAGRQELAAEQAMRAIGQQPDWPAAWNLYLQAMIGLDRAAEALPRASAAVASHPDNVQLRVAYARALLQSREFGAAREQLQTLLSQSPDDAQILYPLALLAMNMRQPDLARGYLLRLVELGQRGHEARYYLGQLEESEGDFDRALEWYRGVGRGEFALEAMIRVAVITSRLGDLERALGMLQDFRSSHSDSAVRLYLAEAELLRGASAYVRAFDVLDRALSEHPAQHDLLYARALAAERLDRLDVLEQDLRLILSTQPDHAPALNALGYTLADRTQRYQEALGYIERALALEPEDPAVIDSMGWVLYRLGRHEEAIQYLRRALELGEDPEIAAHLGEVLWVVGQRAEARGVWQRALQSNPDAAVLREVMQRLEQ